MVDRGFGEFVGKGTLRVRPECGRDLLSEMSVGIRPPR